MIFDLSRKDYVIAEGRKDDSGKPPMSLIPRRALIEEARVLEFGARKYDAWNWARGMRWSRLLDAAMRHLTAYADGEDVDPETGISHMAHVRCCAGFLLDLEQSHPELDDRRRSGNDVSNVQDAVGKGGAEQLPLF